jgi:biotin synthase-like enzyme
MVEGVRALGMETCATLACSRPPRAARLKQAGLDYYNHNLDTSERFYGEIITTRTYRDRLDTLAHVRDAGIAVARILLPASVVRLSAGREGMRDETQALCFLAGANSIFVGPKLLTTPNPKRERDRALFARLGLEPMPLPDADPERS